MRDFNVYASAIDILFSHSREHDLKQYQRHATLDGRKKNKKLVKINIIINIKNQYYFVLTFLRGNTMQQR